MNNSGIGNGTLIRIQRIYIYRDGITVTYTLMNEKVAEMIRGV